MQEAEFIVDGDTGPSKAEKVKQLANIMPIGVSDDMPSGQKVFADNYNLMIETLIANKLMRNK